MNFDPTETQVLLGDMVRGLIEAEYDFEIRRTRLAKRGGGSPSPLWARLAELGVLGVEIEEAHGGSGGGFEDLVAVMGPLGSGLVVEPFLSTVVLSAGLVAALGSPAQKAELLPAVGAGRLRLALAHGEQRARGELAWVESRAERMGDGWRLAGAKAMAFGADAAERLIVSARTSGAAGQCAGVSLFLVAADAPGLTLRGYDLYDGSGAADLQFDGLELAGEALLGIEGEAISALDLAYDRARAAVCAEAVGAMERLRDITADYVKTRVQFGQPIGKFQALQHRLVDAHVEVELARSMALLAADAVSEPDPARRGRAVAAAKERVGRAARTVGQTAVQLHGGIALTDEYAAGHYFKRLTMIERQFGDVASSLRRFMALAA